MEIYDRIKQDHDHARALLNALKEERSDDKRAALFDELKREIWVHAKVEETVFYLPLIDRRKTRAESLRQRLRERARDIVGGAARGVRHDDPDRLGRPVERRRGHRGKQGSGEEDGAEHEDSRLSSAGGE